MNYINLPAETPQNMMHKTFYSQSLNHDIGYNIYLPPDYQEKGKRYPVTYHIHGWQGNESSEIWPLEKVYRKQPAITVFINSLSSETEYFDALWQIESILIEELIPHIDGQYRTIAVREGRRLSGFSMGGAMAFYYAVKNSELFHAVTSYAGTYHHQYHKEYCEVWKTPEMSAGLYEDMMQQKRYLETNNILCLVRQKADVIRKNLHIGIHIGTNDIVFCDNEIMHLYLDSLNIPHDYRKFIGVEHNLNEIL